MGTNIKDLVVMKEISFEELKGKIIAIDTFNILYQFITTIRQRDGSMLKDSHGKVTSHLTGIFNRTTKLMKLGIKPVFVFDGKPPELKTKERERRRKIKIEAQQKYEEATKKEDLEAMKKYSARTARLTSEMIEETKELLEALGLPVIQAPSEGEAQVAHIVNRGDAWAGVSEDYDILLYGIPRMIKNLTISGKRRIGAAHITIKPKIINFTETLNNLGIDKEQLRILAIMVGTDYDPGGVKGIGPKTALKLVKENKKDYDKMFEQIKWDYEFPWTDIYYLIKNMPVNSDYELKWSKVNKEKIKQLLIEKHDFAIERVQKVLDELEKKEGDKVQKGLGDWT